MKSLHPEKISQILVFTLDEPGYALDLSAVERVVRAVEVTPLPKAPEIVLGVIDVRKRFGLPPRETRLNDRFIIARTPRRNVALVVDSVAGLRKLADRDLAIAGQSLPFAEHLQGVTKIEDDLILIYDLDRFLSLEEERMLDEALA